MYCRSCGTQNSEKASFCNHCGSSINDSSLYPESPGKADTPTTPTAVPGPAQGEGSDATEKESPDILPICPRCGATMKFGFCLVCDKATVVNENPPSRICPHCGYPVGDEANFCGSCGKKVP